MEIDVQHIAALAKLRLEEDKVPRFAKEMAGILQMVENLPELSEEGALLDTGNTMGLRPDVVRPSAPREEILQNAPDVTDGCFLVPKTVD